MNKQYKALAKQTTNPAIAEAVLSGSDIMPANNSRKARKLAKYAGKTVYWHEDHRFGIVAAAIFSPVLAALLAGLVDVFTSSAVSFAAFAAIETGFLATLRRRWKLMSAGFNREGVLRAPWGASDLRRSCNKMLERSDVLPEANTQTVALLNRYIEIAQENLDSSKSYELLRRLCYQAEKHADLVASKYKAVTGYATPEERAKVLSGAVERAELQAREAAKNAELEAARQDVAYRAISRQLAADDELLNQEAELTAYAVAKLSS